MHEIYPQKYRACPRRFGKGRIRCPTCKGRHEIINTDSWHPGVNVPAWEYKPCPNPKCSGRGTIECPICEGRGYVEREQRLKASNAELIREGGSPVPGNESLYDELKDRFYAARKVALDSLDGQAISPYWRELKRERLRDIEFHVLAGTYLGTVVKSSLPTPYEEKKLKELGLEPQKVDLSNYPDDKSEYHRELAAEMEMLRIFYVAAARGIL
jgi:hypothetical protein